MSRQALAAGQLNPRSLYRRRLRHPWCWPLDAELEAACLGAGFERPVAARVGETVGVTLGPRVLWRLSPHEGEADVSFVGEAAATAWRAPRVVLSALPVACRVERLRASSELRVASLVSERPRPSAIDGGSLGLAKCLAHASLLLDTVLPTDVIGMAAVAADGGLHPVEGLSEKLEWVWEAGLGVSRALVAKTQPEAHPGLDLVRVRTLREALDVVWPALDAQLRARLEASPTLAAEVALELRRLVVADRPGLVSWRVVLRTAEIVLSATADPLVREDAELARSVAARHEGRVAPLLKPFEHRRLAPQRPQRLRLLAQWVQSHADGEDDEAAVAAAREALTRVAEDGDRTDGDAVVLGAVGRALASAGHELEALSVLEQAVALWLALEREPDATYALCELIRVAGVLSRMDVLERALGWIERVRARPDTDPMSMLFVDTALVRAWVQVGRPERVLELGPATAVSQVLAPDHLRASRLRWEARALDALRRPMEADERRACLENGAYVALSRLDRALRDGLDPQPCLEALAATDAAPELSRLLRRCPADVLAARWVADRYRH